MASAQLPLDRSPPPANQIDGTGPAHFVGAPGFAYRAVAALQTAGNLSGAMEQKALSRIQNSDCAVVEHICLPLREGFMFFFGKAGTCVSFLCAFTAAYQFAITTTAKADRSSALARERGSEIHSIRIKQQAELLDPAGLAAHVNGLSGKDGLVLAAGAVPSIFGSVAIPFAPIPAEAMWQRVLAERADQILAKGCAAREDICGTAVVRRLTAIRNRASQLSPIELLGAVNSAVNESLAYRRDAKSYGKTDHWATLSETASRGAGDCEDFAIAKMWALKSAGIALSAMRLVIVRDSRRQRYHAVLAVRSAGETFILDSATSSVNREPDFGHYTPIYSLAEGRSWIHGFESGDVVAARDDLERARPGEPAAAGSS